MPLSLQWLPSQKEKGSSLLSKSGLASSILYPENNGWQLTIRHNTLKLPFRGQVRLITWINLRVTDLRTQGLASKMGQGALALQAYKIMQIHLNCQKGKGSVKKMRPDTPMISRSYVPLPIFWMLRYLLSCGLHWVISSLQYILPLWSSLMSRCPFKHRVQMLRLNCKI